MRPSRVRRLFAFVSRTPVDVHKDVRDEVEFHLEMRAADLIAEGLTAAEARRRAREEFGDVERSSALLATQDSTLECATKGRRQNSRGCAPSPPG